MKPPSELQLSGSAEAGGGGTADGRPPTDWRAALPLAGGEDPTSIDLRTVASNAARKDAACNELRHAGEVLVT